MSQLDRPIILFCSERSGSNLITKIFDAHPSVCAPGASHLFKVMSECASRYALDSDALRNAVLTLFDAKVSRWQIDDWSQSERAQLLYDHDSAGAMAAALYNAEVRVGDKQHVMLKENSAFAYLPMLFAQSESPRILFMVRDPRDMAVSWINGPVMRGGVVRAADRWVYDQDGFLSALYQLHPGTHVGFLRYEDLLEEPERELRRTCADLQLEFCESMLNFAEHSSSARVDATRSTMWSNIDKGLLQNNKNKYFSHLDDNDIAYIEAMAGSLLTAMGYESVRTSCSPFGGFETLEALRVFLSNREPFEKPVYQDLPADERARFEAWSRLRSEMVSRPVISPADFLRSKST